MPPPYLISLDFAETKADVRIDYFTRRVFVKLPPGADPKHLTPQVAVFQPGTRVFVGDKQLDDKTILDLSSHLRLRLVAPNGTANDWRVTLAPAKP